MKTTDKCFSELDCLTGYLGLFLCYLKLISISCYLKLIRRQLKRTLLLVTLCSMTILFNQEIYVFFASLSLPFQEPFEKQSELDRRHQSAFLKKRFCIHHVPPARAADKKIQPT